ncbi:hypothetical protein ACRJ4W_37040 [Streptomyces sp. GLT-R25]
MTTARRLVGSLAVAAALVAGTTVLATAPASAQADAFRARPAPARRLGRQHLPLLQRVRQQLLEQVRRLGQRLRRAHLRRRW